MPNPTLNTELEAQFKDIVAGEKPPTGFNPFAILEQQQQAPAAQPLQQPTPLEAEPVAPQGFNPFADLPSISTSPEDIGRPELSVGELPFDRKAFLTETYRNLPGLSEDRRLELTGAVESLRLQKGDREKALKALIGTDSDFPNRESEIKATVEILKKWDQGKVVPPWVKPEAPEEQKKAEREVDTTKPEAFRAAQYAPDDDLLPTLRVDLNEIAAENPQLANRLKALYKGADYKTNLSDDEQEYTRKWREYGSNYVKDLARVLTNPKNWLPFRDRFWGSAAEEATFGIVPTADVSKKLADMTSEEWLKESTIPENLGRAAGFVAGGVLLGGAIPAVEKGLAWASPRAARFATKIFGGRAGNAVKEVAPAAEVLIPEAKLSNVASQVLKGTVAEGTLGAAIGLARDPKEDETRIDNAIEYGLSFAAGGALIRGALGAKEFIDKKAISKAVSGVAENLGISKEDAAILVMKRNPSAARLMDLDPKKIAQIEAPIDLGTGETATLEQALSANYGVKKLAEENKISLYQAARQVKQVNPKAKLPTDFYEAAKDVEIAASDYMDWFPVQLDASGDLKSGTTTKLLEKAGEFFYKNDTSVRPIRRWLIGDAGNEFEGFLLSQRSSEAALNERLSEAGAGVKKIKGLIDEFKASVNPAQQSAANLRAKQVLEGSVTQNETLKKMQQEYRSLHAEYEGKLREYGLLGETRFNQTRGSVNAKLNEKRLLIEKQLPLVSPRYRDEVKKAIDERAWESGEELRSYLESKSIKTNVGEKFSQGDLDQIANLDQFVRTSYKEAGREHLRRYYEIHENGRKTALGYYLSQRSARVNVDQFKQRLDIPSDIRKELGEIDDTVYLAGKTIYDQVKAVSNAEYQRAIAFDSNISRPALVKIPGKRPIVNPEVERLIKEEGWVQLPESARLGELSGHAVAPYVYDDMAGLGLVTKGKSETSQAWDDILKTYRKGISAYKLGKVVFNPASWGRDVISNSVMLNMSGMSVREQAIAMKRAASSIANKDAEFELFKKMGGLEGLSQVDDDVFRTLEKRLSSNQTTIGGLQDFFNTIAETRQGEALGKLTNRVKAGYAAKDTIFRLTKFLDLRAKGYAPEAAMKETFKWIFDYRDLPQSVRLARDTYSVFISYSSKAIPRFFETLITKPWKVASYGYLASAMSNVDLALQEESQYGAVNTLFDFLPDELRRASYNLPQWQDESVLPTYAQSKLTSVGWPKGWLPEKLEYEAQKNGLVIPRMLRLPFRDRFDREQFLDLTYMLPFGNLGEPASAKGLPIPQVLGPSHPFINFITAAQTGVDPFTGKEIANKADPFYASKWMQYMGRTLLPVLSPGGYSFEKVMAALEKNTDVFDRAQMLPVVLTDVLLGIKLRPYNIGQEQIQRLKEAEKDIETVNDLLRMDARKAATGEISNEAFKKNQDEYVKQIKAIARRMGVLSNFGRKPELE